MQLGAAQLGAAQLGGAASMRSGANGTLMATYAPVTPPATIDVGPVADFEGPSRDRDRQELGNEMAAATFGGWLGGTLGHTSVAALLGGVTGWLGYRHISQRKL